MTPDFCATYPGISHTIGELAGAEGSKWTVSFEMDDFFADKLKGRGAVSVAVATEHECGIGGPLKAVPHALSIDGLYKLCCKVDTKHPTRCRLDL